MVNPQNDTRKETKYKSQMIQHSQHPNVYSGRHNPEISRSMALPIYYRMTVILSKLEIHHNSTRCAQIQTSQMMSPEIEIQKRTKIAQSELDEAEPGMNIYNILIILVLYY